MKVIKATNATIDAIRKMNTVSRSHISVSGSDKKSSTSFPTSFSAGYTGPFQCIWESGKTVIRVVSPSKYYPDGEYYSGSLLAPDMQIIAHINQGYLRYTPGQENTLIVLKAVWRNTSPVGKIESTQFVWTPDPWKSLSEEDRLIAADYLNPKDEYYPERNPWISLFPIARIISDTTIEQIQFGHITDYSRWWRA